MKSQKFKTTLLIIFIAAVYFIAGKFGLQLAFVHTNATAVWPPTGIAIAVLLLAGYRVWPSILVGAFFINYMTVSSFLTSLGIAADQRD